MTFSPRIFLMSASAKSRRAMVSVILGRSAGRSISAGVKPSLMPGVRAGRPPKACRK
ncbi:hypothetical protein HNR40_004857 [Nonomuraea endophytica]|uniref:Uncharacterized protein n=1 Tax=Nonomuraea endophytica TaxID=714136 RepID=A0A7W8A637_9ACTN|nr:hypothetical protein [Nonomuraea endophytica]MBB5079371.1 hypothetical protein [Nonomuraea endophytica]